MSTFAAQVNATDKSQLLSNSHNAGLLSQRKCAFGLPKSSLTGEYEGKTRLQAKLTIGASNDPLEQEADRVADQVLAAPIHSAVSGAAPCIQRFTGQGTGDAGAAPASVDRVLSGSGRPLDPAVQQDMGQRFGHDFSQVRVHTDSVAEQSAQDINAHAYTVGHNIVFGAGGFAPRSHEGRRLIAHELTHVLQQSDGDGLRIQRQEPPKKESVATATTEVTLAATTTSTSVPMQTATPVVTDPAKLSGKKWWDSNENKAPYTKSADISDLESDFQTKVNEFKGALDTAGASISIDTTKRPAERAYILHYAWVIAKDGFDASKVPAKENVDIEWDHGDATKSKAGAQEIITTASVASTPSLTSNHIAGKAIDWTITWITDLKIKNKDATQTEIKSEPRNGGDPGNLELHDVGKSYGVKKGLFTKKDPPHWSSDGT